MKEVQTYTLDAKGQILGRLATKAAVLLRGKNKKTYRTNEISGDRVIIYNAKLIKVTGNKLKQKMYYRHSSYPGSLKSQNLENILNKKPKEVIFKAIRGMLPDNRLRNNWLKNLIIKEGANE